MSEADILSREALVCHLWDWAEDRDNGWKRSVRPFAPIARDAGVRLSGARGERRAAIAGMVDQIRNASPAQLQGYWNAWDRCLGDPEGPPDDGATGGAL